MEAGELQLQHALATVTVCGSCSRMVQLLLEQHTIQIAPRRVLWVLQLPGSLLCLLPTCDGHRIDQVVCLL
jgi:hypothetical protein